MLVSEGSLLSLETCDLGKDDERAFLFLSYATSAEWQKF